MVGMVPLPERVLSKVHMAAPWECWLWTAYRDPMGYGRVRVGEQIAYAHRVFYEAHNGMIPSGMELDHLCRVRHCVNPYHLDAVSHRENCRRGNVGRAARERGRRITHCKYGHLFDVANTYRAPNGRRSCRACGRDRYYRMKSREF